MTGCEREGTACRAERTESFARRVSRGLAALVAIEFSLGVAALVVVPFARPSGWIPRAGTAMYLVHAALGAPLGIGALALLVRVRGSRRILALTGWIGAVGVALAAAGGLLSVVHALRIPGALCMLIGSLTAGFGYALPTIERLDDRSRLHTTS